MNAHASKNGNGSGGWIVGVVFVLIGGGLLLGNLTGLSFGNWWALYLLIPVFGALVAGYNIYRKTGTLDGAVTAVLIGGGIPALIFVFLFFSLDWALFWPASLILIGGGMVLKQLAR